MNLLTLQHRQLKSPIHWRNRQHAAKVIGHEDTKTQRRNSPSCPGASVANPLPLITNASLRAQFNALPALLAEQQANLESVLNINAHLMEQRERSAA